LFSFFLNSEKAGSSPCHLPLEVRLKITRGVARGLAYTHDKKHVHGSIKPSNILLNSDMEPIISDFGLDRLVLGNTSQKANTSARLLGIQRPTATREDHSIGSTPYAPVAPYQAPESLKNIKPNPKWDVYSFGILLLELLTGKVFSDRELGQWTAGSVAEEKSRVLRLVDVSIKAEVEGKEDALLACFKLGLSCASFVPQKRPSMKEALQVLERISYSLS
jgi:serine/threonine protein kinase